MNLSRLNTAPKWIIYMLLITSLGISIFFASTSYLRMTELENRLASFDSLQVINQMGTVNPARTTHTTTLSTNYVAANTVNTTAPLNQVNNTNNFIQEVTGVIYKYVDPAEVPPSRVKLLTPPTL